MGKTTEIAVTSVAARCAGASSADEYWNLLESAQPQFRGVPPSRWRERPAASRPGRGNLSYSHVMAPVRDPYALDARHRRIPRARALRMDPQQRMALGLTEELLAGSRIDVSAATEGRISTVIGVSSTDYRSVSSAAVVADMLTDGSLGRSSAGFREALRGVSERSVRDLSAHTMPGVLANMVAAVVQSSFDLRGSAYTMDAACASGLIAIDTACGLLTSGRADACIAGGVYVALTPEAHIAFSAVGALSPTGVCRPFTSMADGFVIGDGGALVLLRRLEDARRDGDRIWAVVEARGSSSDGRAPGIMTPTAAGQRAAVEEALASSGQRVLEVDAVEGHGTGTEVGDRTEIETLRRVVDPSAQVLLGSCKAVIGHTMAASGALSFVKAAQALARGTWPPQPGVPGGRWSPQLVESPLLPACRGAVRHRPIRRAAVNSFGFGGTNSHLVLRGPEVEPRG
ncbi:polyketide synthase [Rothia halotolerans]|uniref:beta-ketoacyl [acyl carrier protein] synthase domain-containing protein n=1 Tax=Rothia halotolerans TaxID=405770 RepID=UPI0013ECBCA1|nr:polyketide synthase [Rothia halotolerans]